MDVEARRAIWDLLLYERGRRTIILTTHFMEEADVLGDRIGIMSHGKLQCCGTTNFLKRYYGAGFILSVTMKNTITSETQNAVLSLIQSHVPSASIQHGSISSSMTSKDLLIVIPTDDCPTSEFPSIFKDLQSRKQNLGIDSINGLSLTTMDEVFVK
jgi:ATP-binding cassette subfamily A (ABC1) protein 3